MKLKRLFDFIVSAIGFFTVSPALAMVAVFIKLDSAGPVFFHASRVGAHGRPFTMFKFRSMVKDASSRGPGITTGGDARVTRVGAVLRRFKIDELPQLFNVLNGDMSFVGPRPEDPRYVAAYTPEQRRALSVRPGITSPASLIYRSEESLLTGDDWERKYVTEILPHKLAVEVDYIGKRNFREDLRIIVRTVLASARKSHTG